MSNEFDLPETANAFQEEIVKPGTNNAFEAEIIKAGPNLQPIIRSAFQVYRNQLEELRESALAIVVTNENDKDGMQKAAEMRKKLVSCRTGLEKKRKELKQESLDMGRAIDGSARIITNDIEPLEAHLLLQETFAKRMESERLDKRMNERLAQLEPFREAYIPIATEIRAMQDEQFQQTLEIARMMLERKKQQEQIQLNERTRQDRLGKIMPFIQYAQHPIEYAWETYTEEGFQAELTAARNAHNEAVATLAREAAELKKKQEELEEENRKLADENAAKERALREEENKRLQAERIANAAKHAAESYQRVSVPSTQSHEWDMPDGEPVSQGKKDDVRADLAAYLDDLEAFQEKHREKVEKGNVSMTYVWNMVTEAISHGRTLIK